MTPRWRAPRWQARTRFARRRRGYFVMDEASGAAEALDDMLASSAFDDFLARNRARVIEARYSGTAKDAILALIKAADTLALKSEGEE